MSDRNDASPGPFEGVISASPLPPAEQTFISIPE